MVRKLVVVTTKKELGNRLIISATPHAEMRYEVRQKIAIVPGVPSAGVGVPDPADGQYKDASRMLTITYQDRFSTYALLSHTCSTRP